jgi:ABC-2 type transport system ATP-binding protein
MSAVIELSHLTKTYGKSRGVTNISLEVPEGTVFGFLGPNGAGKSTTINMLVNFTRPTSGSIKIFGKDSIKYGLSIRKDIGFLASDMALDGNLTGWQQVEYFGNLRGKCDKVYIKELSRRFDCNLGRKIKTLSRGNRQKVALISALMHKPKLLLLDEPTSGLDPLVQAEFNKIILEHKAAGNSTFISSHVLSEIQELCDRVAFIRQGEIIANKTLDELAEGSPKEIRVICSDKSLATRIKRLTGIKHLKASGKHITFSYVGSVNDLTHLFGMYNLEDLTIQEAELESTFMQFYEDDNGTSDA